MNIKALVPSILKDWLRPYYGRLRRAPAFRKWATANFSCGRIAFGERNTYLAVPVGWVTVDLEDADFNIDLTRHERLPFVDGSQSVIYSAHMIEHLDQETLVHFLKEAYRILKPGGFIRLEAPDVEIIVQEYRRPDSKIFEDLMQDLETNIVKKLGYAEEYSQRHIALIGFVSGYVENGRHIPVFATQEEVDTKLKALNLDEFGQWCVSLQTEQQQKTHGHLNPLYFEKLRSSLAEKGFRDIRRMKNGETRIGGISLEGIERKERSTFSFYTEARK